MTMPDTQLMDPLSQRVGPGPPQVVPLLPQQLERSQDLVLGSTVLSTEPVEGGHVIAFTGEEDLNDGHAQMVSY